MLPKLNRIKKEKDFKILFQKGKVIRGRQLLIKYGPNGLSESRFGFIISSKISPKAVFRNKLRRNLSQLIRQNLGSIEIGWDLGVLITAKEKQIDLELIGNELLALLRKIKIYHE